MSTKYKLNLEDIRRILRNVAIIYSPVIIMFLDQIQKWTFDEKILYALFISTTIDVIRRFLNDYSK